MFHTLIVGTGLYTNKSYKILTYKPLLYSCLRFSTLTADIIRYDMNKLTNPVEFSK